MPSGPFLLYPRRPACALSAYHPPPFRPPLLHMITRSMRKSIRFLLPFAFFLVTFTRYGFPLLHRCNHGIRTLVLRIGTRSDPIAFYFKSDDAKTHQLKKPVAHAHRLGRIIATLVHLCIMQYYGLKAITRTKSLYSGLLHRFQQKTVLSDLIRNVFVSPHFPCCRWGISLSVCKTGTAFALMLTNLFVHQARRVN